MIVLTIVFVFLYGLQFFFGRDAYNKKKAYECANKIAAFKAHVVEEMAVNGQCPAPDIYIETSGKFVKNITLSKKEEYDGICIYTCEFKSEEAELAPYVLSYKYQDESWTCKTEAGTTLPKEYRPRVCRDDDG
jgi:hypothetical protein